MAEHFFRAFQIPKAGAARVDPALVKSMLGVPLVTDGHVGSSDHFSSMYFPLCSKYQTNQRLEHSEFVSRVFSSNTRKRYDKDMFSWHSIFQFPCWPKLVKMKQLKQPCHWSPEYTVKHCFNPFYSLCQLSTHPYHPVRRGGSNCPVYTRWVVAGRRSDSLRIQRRPVKAPPRALTVTHQTSTGDHRQPFLLRKSTWVSEVTRPLAWNFNK